jgi:hypothetical protein
MDFEDCWAVAFVTPESGLYFHWVPLPAEVVLEPLLGDVVLIFSGANQNILKSVHSFGKTMS